MVVMHKTPGAYSKSIQDKKHVHALISSVDQRWRPALPFIHLVEAIDSSSRRTYPLLGIACPSARLDARQPIDSAIPANKWKESWIQSHARVPMSHHTASEKALIKVSLVSAQQSPYPTVFKLLKCSLYRSGMVSSLLTHIKQWRLLQCLKPSSADI